MKKISIGLLDELSKNQQRISELEMKSFVGGGSGTADAPYSIIEMESLMDSYQWSGGYVEYLGYVSFSPHVYGSYYGGYCHQYTGNFSAHMLTLESKSWDQAAEKVLSSWIPLLGPALDYLKQELHDCKVNMLIDIANLGYADPEQQISYVMTPCSYSSETTNWSTIMAAYDAVTGELLVKYKMDNWGFFEKIQ